MSTFEVKGNENYAGILAEIKTIIPLKNCDNIQHTTLFGNYVIIGKDVKVGDKGVYFPSETKLNSKFLSNNNLYRNKELNADKSKAGFFEENGRIRCMKFRGNKSDGFFVPFSFFSCYISDFHSMNVLDESTIFDTINGENVCEKYYPKNYHVRDSSSNNNSKVKKNKFKRIIDTQWRFHIDTAQLGRNIHKLELNDVINISQKIHGCNVCIGNVLCNKKLTFAERLLKKLKFNIQDKQYEIVYSSRKVIKNSDINKKANHYYGTDIWGDVCEEVKHLIPKGITLYGEIVGYTKEGKPIQKNYDYGCNIGEHKFFVYRMTNTNEDGIVTELPMSYIQAWCKSVGLNGVDVLYEGSVRELYKDLHNNYCESLDGIDFSTFKPDLFLKMLTDEFLEKKCSVDDFNVYCNNDVWDEGIVLRKVNTPDIEVYKLKSYNFKLGEAKELDSGEVNMEDSQEG